MIKLTNRNKKILKIVGITLFVIYIFGLCFTWSTTIPFNRAPDEQMKYDVCKYICDNLKLPHGGDESIRNATWGISYAFTPILSYMFSGTLMRIVTFFTQNEFTLVVAARFVSVLCMVGYTIMNIKIASKLFKGAYKWLYVVFVTLLPQVVYLGSYLNNDSLALFSISIIVYSWIIGLERNWDWKSCVLMAIGIGICALSYYNAYGYILCSIIIYFVSSYIKKINLKEFFKKGIIIALIAFLLAGWWFIRNFILYDGDFLGLNVSREYGEQYALEQYKPSNRPTPANQNMPLKEMLFDKEWIDLTIRSSIGLFGYMDTVMEENTYTTYKNIFIVGLIGALGGWIIKKVLYSIKRKEENKIKVKEEKIVSRKEEIKKKIKKHKRILFNVIMIICIIIPIMLSLYYSYFNDFQPQGRYIMPMIIPFMYFVVKGIKNILDFIIRNVKVKNAILILFIILWSIMPIIIYFKYIKG